MRQGLIGLMALVIPLSAGGGWNVAFASAEAAGGADSWIGKAAPGFRLSTVDGEREVESDTLFAFSSVTMLVFWTTHCAECVRRLEASQSLHAWGSEDGLNVVGVNFDEQPSAKIRMLARQATPDLIQLYDADGAVTSRYGAGAHSFAVYLVDSRGIVRDARFDPPVDSLAAMKPTLEALIDAAFADDGSSGSSSQTGEVNEGWLADLLAPLQSKLSAHGRARVRWMNIDTTGVGATGAFSEPLKPGTFLHYRLEMELGYAISSKLRAGGLLWLSNEGEAVMRSGPAYLSSPRGSAFVQYNNRATLPLIGDFDAGLRGGYYEIAWTPLTLMRWDKDDTPISGGQRAAGCGVCGGEAGLAGFILQESVETLAPELTFEGARADVALFDRLDASALYARPHTPDPVDTDLCSSPDRDPTHYLQQVFGGRGTYHASSPWSSRPLDLSATAIATEEDDEHSPCSISLMDKKPFSDRVFSADIRAPLPARTDLYAEFARSWWRPDKTDRTADALTGNALRGGIVFDIRTSVPLGWPISGGASDPFLVKLDLSYQRMSASFYSAYSALSYESNLQGPRVSMRADWGPVGLGAFLKRLEPVSIPADAPSGDWRKQTASLWIDGRVWGGATLMAGGVRDERKLPPHGLTAATDDRQDVFIVSFVQELAPRSSLILEAQRLDGSREVAHQDYASTTIRAMLDVAF